MQEIMNSKRISFIMIGLLAFLAVASIAVVILGNMLLQKQSTQLTDLKVQNEILEQQQTALLRANKDVQKYSELEKLAKSIVPQDKDQAKAVREILKIAEESNIPISSIAFPSSSLGSTVPKSTTGGSATNSPAATGSTGSTPTTSTSVTQVTPVTGSPGLYSMDITVQSDANNPRPYQNLITFLSNLERNRRTAQVSQLVITPYTKDIRLLSFSLSIKVFIKP
jgi:hypothetical protein